MGSPGTSTCFLIEIRFTVKPRIHFLQFDPAREMGYGKPA